jgi:hypothetical protein
MKGILIQSKVLKHIDSEDTDHRRALIQEAIKAKLPAPADGYPAYCYIVEFDDTTAVYEFEGRYYQAPYSISDGKVNVGEAYEVRQAYVRAE